MPFFTSPDGVKLHYEVEGAGPPLLLHLGAGCDAELWSAAGYVEPLAKAYKCILFDHRGHGQSDHPASAEANHIDRYADDVAALVNHLGHPSVSFFGWSNAVPIGLKVADEHPEIFDSLILFGPISPRATKEEVATRIDSALTALREKGWWALLDGMIASEKFSVPKWFLDRVVATDIEPYIAWAEARPNWNWSPWDALPTIKAPALVIVGELEDPNDVMGGAASLMPNATRVRIADREHINAFLDTGFVVPLVMDFLAARQTNRVPAARPANKSIVKEAQS
jgi:pimeloyl-ACP methyl ester carboxylesterase